MTYPKRNMQYEELKIKGQTGDLILTKGTKNLFGYLHNVLLDSPVTHVSLLVKSESNDLFIFESGAPRGVQLRSLDLYLRDGADAVWFMPFNLSESKRRNLQLDMEKMANLSYDYNFMISHEVFGFDSPYYIERKGYSCADLVAEILRKNGILKTKKNILFPKNFIDNSLEYFVEPIDVINILYQNAGHEQNIGRSTG